ncbi:MAG: hypothetical protein V1899_11795, partial [Planctomycetota bacterium]
TANRQNLYVTQRFFYDSFEQKLFPPVSPSPRLPVSPSPRLPVNNAFWLRLGCAYIVVVALIFGLNLTAQSGEGSATADLVLQLKPLSGRLDPGPTTILGADACPGGTQYVSSNIYIDGASDCRIYFDYRDKQNFHYVDRQGLQVKLGLCEAGIEQMMSAGMLKGVAPLRLARHAAHIGLFQGAKLIASAFDDRLLSGAIGYRLLGKNTTPLTLKAEACDDIHFSDDFMIGDVKSSQWRGKDGKEHTDFAVKSLRHPALSANAFNYMGAGINVYSVVGQLWWDHYRYAVALRGPVGQVIGLIFAFQNDRNYGLFRWSAQKANEPGKRELVVIQDGQEEVVASVPGGYTPNQWYSAEIRATYTRVSLMIDGHALLEASDPRLASGGVGVWCDVALPATPATAPKAQPLQINSLNDLMKQHAVFDDVVINTLDGFEDDFRVPGLLSGGWLLGRGRWEVPLPRDATADGGELRVIPGDGQAKALLGDRRWAQYVLQVEVIPGNGSSGIIFLHRDESNYYAATLDHDTLKLIRVCDGQETTVDSVAFPRSTTGARLKATIQHGHVRVQAEALNLEKKALRAVLVETFDNANKLCGRAGLLASGHGSDESRITRFRHFRLSFLPEFEPLVTTNAIFESETSMTDWANPTREWYSSPNQSLVNGRPANELLHNSQFPGDVELMVEPREFSDPKYEIGLAVSCKDRQRSAGYVCRYRSSELVEGVSRPVNIQLLRQGQVVLEKSLEDVRQLTSLAIRRCGKYIVGVVNGRAVATYRDESPLNGTGVAFYTQGVTIRMEAIKIVSDHFHNESFSLAPVAWRTAGAAIAEVTNRWQCDSRWSFFSLKNDRQAGNPAVLWSKNLYPGDVTIEFYVSNKMEPERGPPYTYARDINVTLCSDGADLTQGYTCMFGGDGNKGSMIMRDGVPVRRSSRAIPTDMNNMHRHWFAIKVEKRGNIVSFRVDRYFVDEAKKTQEMIYEDTQPLKGDHLAIWTYNHAIMISRIRISGEGGNVSDHPDWQPGALMTHYDK